MTLETHQGHLCWVQVADRLVGKKVSGSEGEDNHELWSLTESAVMCCVTDSRRTHPLPRHSSPQWFLYVVFQNHLTLQSSNRITISCIVAQSCNGFIGCCPLALANIFRCKNNFAEQLCLRLSSCRTYFGNKITDTSQVESIWPSAGFVYVRACQSCDDAKQSPALSAPE